MICPICDTAFDGRKNYELVYRIGSTRPLRLVVCPNCPVRVELTLNIGFRICEGGC